MASKQVKKVWLHRVWFLPGIRTDSEQVFPAILNNSVLTNKNSYCPAMNAIRQNKCTLYKILSHQNIIHENAV